MNKQNGQTKEMQYCIHKQSLVHHNPQTDGFAERFNGTLAEGLSMYVSMHQNDLD